MTTRQSTAHAAHVSDKPPGLSTGAAEEDLLFAMADALVVLQSSDGSIRCPACAAWHTRAGEAVYPFAVCYQRSQQPKYLAATLSLGSWLITRQQPDGCWYETSSTLPATTVFQLMALAAAYLRLQDQLPDQEQIRWRTAIDLSATWVSATISEEYTYINYCASSAAALMLAYQVLRRDALKARAAGLARQVLRKIDRQGILWGEGPYYLRGLGRITGRGGVDIAYNLDMSLGALGLYACLASDDACRRAVTQSLESHLCFLYPDGSIDDSWGTRSYKWTGYGSQTAHGVQMALALLTGKERNFAQVYALTLACLSQSMHNGLLGYGPHSWWNDSFQPCIYPTFTRATALAFAVDYGDPSRAAWNPNAAVMRQEGITFFPSLHVCVVSTPHLKATISAYRPGYVRWNSLAQTAHALRRRLRRRQFRMTDADREPATPTGGCLTYLWIEGYGIVQAASQTSYWPVEPMHMPATADVDTLTPHIRTWLGNRRYTNLYDRRVTLQAEPVQIPPRVMCIGQLKDDETRPSGLRFEQIFEFDGRSVTKTVTLRGAVTPDRIEIVEPIIRHRNMLVEASEKRVCITNGSMACEVVLLEGHAQLNHGQDAAKCWAPFPHLYGYPVKIILDDPVTLPVTVRYRVTVKEA